MLIKTDPLAKFIRTTEGWITLLALAVLAVLPIVQSSVSPQLGKSLAIGKILAVVVVVCRTALKVVQVLTGVGLTPIAAPAAAQADVTGAETEIQTVLSAIRGFQSQPAPDPAAIGAGLAPDKVVAAAEAASASA